jgi:predicted peptidase
MRRSVGVLSVVVVAAVFAGLGGRAASRAASQPGETGVLFRDITVAGEARRYALYVPRDLDPAVPAPLILFLHGAGECGTDGQRQAAVGLGPAALLDPKGWPAIIAMPQKIDVNKEWVVDSALVFAVIDETKRERKIDPGRVYLTGLSQGGAGTWAIAAKNPGVFAAIAPVCGYVSKGRKRLDFGDAADAAALAPGLAGVPIWAFHGEKDSVVPADQTRLLVDAAKAAGADVKLTLYPELDHNSWDRAYRGEQLGEWLLSHRLGRPAR